MLYFCLAISFFQVHHRHSHKESDILKPLFSFSIFLKTKHDHAYQGLENVQQQPRLPLL